MDEKEKKLVREAKIITDDIIDGISNLKYSKEVREFGASIDKLEDNKHELNKVGEDR